MGEEARSGPAGGARGSTILWTRRSCLHAAVGFFGLGPGIARGVAPPGSLGERAREYLAELIRLDTSNPPGNETRVAQYLSGVAQAHGIENELVGDNPARLNFVARVRGSEGERPLLLMAHSDVVPAERANWSVDPFGGIERDGVLYGRGAEDTKDLLAAELAVLVELKRSGVKLKRDIILLAEADEEVHSGGMRWMVENAWEKIDAAFAINEGGSITRTKEGLRVYRIQTAEKIPTRVRLLARGTAGHGAVPRPDNAVVRLARALVRLADADQPVLVNPTARTYLKRMSALDGYGWLIPLLGRLENPATAQQAANQIRAHEAELDTFLRTTVSPTILRAGQQANVIPTAAEAVIDVRRLPEESKEEVLARLRRLVNDPAVEVWPLEGPEMPAAPSSPLDSELYLAMERIIRRNDPKAVVVPYLSRGASDSAFLRAKGVAAYGAALFEVEKEGDRSHGNDERRSLENLRQGTELLYQITAAVAAEAE